MKLLERLAALAAQHDELARAFRLTAKALANGALDDAKATLPKKLAKAVKLRQAKNGHGADAEEPTEHSGLTAIAPGVRHGSDAHRLLAWLKDREPQTNQAINRYLGKKFAMDNVVKRGIIAPDRQARPFTYAVTAKGRAALLHVGPVPTKEYRRHMQRRKETRAAGKAKGAVLQQLHAAMQGKGPFTRASLNSLLKAEGISWQGVSAASRYRHVKVSGPKQDRRFEWVSA